MEFQIQPILSAKLAESVLEASTLLAQMGSSSELSLFTYGVSKTPDIRHMLWVPTNGKGMMFYFYTKTYAFGTHK